MPFFTSNVARDIPFVITVIFLLSGEGTVEDIERYNVKPDYIYKDILSLMNDLK